MAPNPFNDGDKVEVSAIGLSHHIEGKWVKNFIGVIVGEQRYPNLVKVLKTGQANAHYYHVSYWKACSGIKIPVCKAPYPAHREGDIVVLMEDNRTGVVTEAPKHPDIVPILFANDSETSTCHPRFLKKTGLRVKTWKQPTMHSFAS